MQRIDRGYAEERGKTPSFNAKVGRPLIIELISKFHIDLPIEHIGNVGLAKYGNNNRIERLREKR